MENGSWQRLVLKNFLSFPLKMTFDFIVFITNRFENHNVDTPIVPKIFWK